MRSNRRGNRRPIPLFLGIMLAGGLISGTGVRAQDAAPSQGGTNASARLLEQPAADYKARRALLMERIKAAEGTAGGTPVVVLAGESEEGDDGRYRQVNPFAYLTGVETPKGTLILKPGEMKETLYLPVRNPSMEAWTGPKLGPGSEGIAATGFDRVEPSASFEADLKAAVADTGKGPGVVYLLTPNPGVNASGPAPALARKVKDLVPDAKTKNVAPILGELRKIKSEAEIALLRKAIALTGDAQAEVIRLVAPGVPEYRLEGAILGAFIGGGGMRAGFPSIVGSGLNSTVLHYNANRRTMAEGDLVVVDIGAEYSYYTADITRTYPVSGKFTPRQREIYQLVLDCQSAAAAEFKIGVTTLRSQNAAAKAFLKASPLRAKDEKGVEHTMDHFFVHGLGHYLGMDVHDVGNGGMPMGPGEVFTIEPGIYIASEGFGVRIEDDYLVTKTGLEKLSGAIPCEVADLERLIAEARSQATPRARAASSVRPVPVGAR